MTKKKFYHFKRILKKGTMKKEETENSDNDEYFEEDIKQECIID